ncbi:glutathione S-transferase family protein [Luteimonas yindakuii]|uniref:glutathione S-transferase family protein n=1 Tax=Luteimonas yindakuii TaxID=2565782 RepID=UPI0010A359AD|nr:glutathione S-transferase family protein [Luteimonas yindakuii]QCO66696.1 glutathione S-transferase family protein [Luteimonas yindakuii]
MPVDQNAPLRITAFEWVPRFARGHVRDLRPRWACEEIGLPYATRLISAVERPPEYFDEQPWGQVPVLEDDGLTLFESGAILLHLGAKDERLLPRDREARARVTSWLFAAYNTVEPVFMEIGNVEIFCRDEPWARLRRPGLLAEAGQRLDRLQAALGTRDWLAGDFSIADIAMVTVLRGVGDTGLLDSRPGLAAYLQRGIARPAFAAALRAQLADFQPAPAAA